jgi:C-terminal processing protease CtpA/Prc
MPRGATTVHGLPEGHVYMTVFANDSNPGWGESAVKLDVGRTTAVDLSIVASWTNGARHDPPERLASLFRTVKDKGYDLGEMLEDILDQQNINHPMDIILFGKRSGFDQAFELPDGVTASVGDLLAVEAYIRLEKLIHDKTEREEALLDKNTYRASGTFGVPRPYAWERTDAYIPPDFETFFPDDPEGGKTLDTYHASLSRSKLPDKDILEIVRRGLRRTTRHRTSILRDVGNRYIWGKQLQNPEAIAIMYHAADPANTYGTRHYAVYFGLSVLESPKPPAVMHALADICMFGEDIGRITWGCRSQLEDLVQYLDPYLGSTDRGVREMAGALGRHFMGEENIDDWMRRRDVEAVKAEFGHQLPEFEHTLLEGDTKARKKIFELLRQHKLLALILDDSFLDALWACAGDPDPEVRRETAKVVGARWSGNDGVLRSDAMNLMMRLAGDEDRDVRYRAVYSGLALVRNMDETLVRRLVDLALEERDPKIKNRIFWCLRDHKEEAARVLEALMDRQDEDGEQARAAFECYPKIVHRDPPDSYRLLGKADTHLAPEEADTIGIGTYESSFRDLHEILGKNYPCFDLKGIDWRAVGEELLPRTETVKNDREFALLCMELIARLDDSHAALLEGTKKIPILSFPRWHPGFACLEDGQGAAVVYHVDRNSPAERAGVKPGMTVIAVDGRPPEEAINECMRNLSRYVGYSSTRYLRYHGYRFFARHMERDVEVDLLFRNADGKEQALVIPAGFGTAYVPRLPVPIEGIGDSKNTSWRMLDDKTGYIYVRRIRNGLNPALDKAVSALRDAKGLIIDVRGNSGGGFDADQAHLNFALDRNEQSPERPRFKGPLAVLIDARCISAGEGWASWFRATGRAKFFGETTAGASSRKTTYTLKNGLYKVQYPVKAYRGFLDRPIERLGIEPDFPVKYKASDIAIGRDTVLEAARAYLAGNQ